MFVYFPSRSFLGKTIELKTYNSSFDIASIHQSILNIKHLVSNVCWKLSFLNVLAILTNKGEGKRCFILASKPLRFSLSQFCTALNKNSEWILEWKNKILFRIGSLLWMPPRIGAFCPLYTFGCTYHSLYAQWRFPSNHHQHIDFIYIKLDNFDFALFSTSTVIFNKILQYSPKDLRERLNYYYEYVRWKYREKSPLKILVHK